MDGNAYEGEILLRAELCDYGCALAHSYITCMP